MAKHQQPSKQCFALEPYLGLALATERELVTRRQTVGMVAIRDIYAATLPRMDEILTFLEGFTTEEVPADINRLFLLAGPTRAVPGLHGMRYTEHDWVDDEATHTEDRRSNSAFSGASASTFRGCGGLHPSVIIQMILRRIGVRVSIGSEVAHALECASNLTGLDTDAE